MKFVRNLTFLFYLMILIIRLIILIIQINAVKTRVFIEQKTWTWVTRFSDIVYRYTQAQVRLRYSNQAWVLKSSSGTQVWLQYLSHSSLSQVKVKIKVSLPSSSRTSKRKKINAKNCNCKVNSKFSTSAQVGRTSFRLIWNHVTSI